MSAAVTLINISPSIVLKAGLRDTELPEELLRYLDYVEDRLESLEKHHCRPLLLKRPEELKKHFEETLPHFMVSLASAILPLSYNILMIAETKGTLDTLISLEKRLFKEIKRAVEKAANEKGIDPEPAIKAHTTAINYDMWLINMASRVGLHGLIERLVERLSGFGEEFAKVLYSMFYAMISVDTALLRNAPYNEETLKTLTEWCSKYAEEVEDYLDTLTFLIPDEEYKAVKDLIAK